jgi:hypothetical protein
MASDYLAPARCQHGFVLAVTLWVLAGITIAVGLMTLWVIDQVQEARQARELLDDEASLYETRDTLLYLISTRERNTAGQPTRALTADELAVRKLSEFGGLSTEPIGGELLLDSKPYQGRGSVTFQLQDEAGLFSTVWPSPSEMDRMLATAGVDSAKWARLKDSLLDYLDPDDLSRINGAEQREYDQAGRSAPANRRLLVPSELAQVIGWNQLEPQQLQSIIEYSSPYYSGAINPNTMPKALLPLRISGCPEVCERLMRERRVKPFQSTHDLQGRMAIQVPGDDALDYRYASGDTLRMTIWRRTGVALRIHVRLTPLADKRGPWSVLAAYPLSRPEIDEPVQPTGSPLFAHSVDDLQ